MLAEALMPNFSCTSVQRWPQLLQVMASEPVASRASGMTWRVAQLGQWTSMVTAFISCAYG